MGGVLSAGSSTQQMKTRPGNWPVTAVQPQGDLLLAKVPSQSRRCCSKCKGREGAQLLTQGWTDTDKPSSHSCLHYDWNITPKVHLA